MKTLILCALSLIGLLTATSPLTAEVPPLPSEVLNARADVVAAGMVKSVKTQRVGIKLDVCITSTVTWAIHYKAKKETLDAREIVVHGWKSLAQSNGPGGHYVYPGFRRLTELKPGDEVRWYLKKREDGDYDILYPNGFAVLSDAGFEKPSRTLPRN